jgi:glycosyltransferase involved in cell wall biosynthesis
MPAWLYEDAALAAAQIALPAIQYNTSCMGLFVGGFRHGPNVDGLQWFLDEVMPLVLAREPRFILHIAGSHMPPALAARANDSIKIEGWVSDEEMAALTARTACTLAPLRFGAGVKGKVVHALASGSPVVSTSVGMQGIPNAGEIAFVGDTAQDFADALIQCLADRTEAQHRAARALSVVKSRYSNGAMASAFAPFLTNASARPPSGTLHPEPTARRISPDL